MAFGGSDAVVVTHFPFQKEKVVPRDIGGSGSSRIKALFCHYSRPVIMATTNYADFMMAHVFTSMPTTTTTTTSSCPLYISLAELLHTYNFL